RETPTPFFPDTAMSENTDSVMSESTESVFSRQEGSSALRKSAGPEGAAAEAAQRSVGSDTTPATDTQEKPTDREAKSEDDLKREALSKMTLHEQKLLVAASKALGSPVTPEAGRRIAACVEEHEADLFAEWLPKVKWLLEKSGGRPDWLADRLESDSPRSAMRQFRAWAAKQGAERPSWRSPMTEFAEAFMGMAEEPMRNCDECECTGFPTLASLREHYAGFHPGKATPGAYLDGEVDL